MMTPIGPPNPVMKIYVHQPTVGAGITTEYRITSEQLDELRAVAVTDPRRDAQIRTLLKKLHR
jgi:hypothetical protein